MSEPLGRIVRSLAGHDRGELMCVVGQREEFLLVADGKRRRAASPKRKKARHVEMLEEFTHPALAKLRCGQTVSDRELRGALAAFKEGITLGER